MTVESDQDLPHELLEKLKNLELELEDGDITKKGFEKKKATLMEQFSQNEGQASTSTNNDNAELADLGPEPSAADVVDFLDYLPSPTHSPPKPASGAALMEQNHRQLQDQQPAQPQQVQQHQFQQQPQYTTADQQSSYRSYAQQQPQQPQQQWQQPPVSYGYNGTMQATDRTHPPTGGGGGQYYHTGVASSPRPSRPYDPRMALPPPRPQYPGNGPPQSSPNMRHQPPYGYSSQQRPPPQGSYRTGPPPPSNPQYHRPVYGTAPPPQQQRPIQQMAGSPRPVYRTGTVAQQPIRPSNYRPVMPPHGNPAHMRTSSLDARSDMMQQHPRPGYSYGAPPPRSQHMQQPPPRNIPPEGWRGQ